MLNYQIHTVETVSKKSKPSLELFTDAVGFVRSLADAVANSPVLADSLFGFFQNVHGGICFAPRSAYLLVNSRFEFKGEELTPDKTNSARKEEA